MTEVLASKQQVVHVPSIAQGIHYFCVLQVNDKVVRVDGEELFVAELGLLEVLLAEVDVCEFHPGFSVQLVNFQVLV